MGLVAIFIGAAVAGLRAKKYDLTSHDMVFAAAFASIGLAAGGAFLYVLVQIPLVAANWGAFVAGLPASLAVFGGMVFYGGLFGALAGLWAYAKIMKQNLNHILILTVPVLPLAHGIMRLGCFAAGCCFGMEHEALGIAFVRSPAAPNGINLLPVQLYESAMNFIIFAVVWLYSKKQRRLLYILCMYGLPYAVGRFALEFLRGDAHRGFVFGLSTSQFISALVAAACVVALVWDKIKHAQEMREKS